GRPDAGRPGSLAHRRVGRSSARRDDRRADPARDIGRPASLRGVRATGPRGMSRGLEISSVANPRVKAAVELRDARARAQTGHTIVDGARELRRALDAGVEVIEAFVCDPLLAGPDARAALDTLLAGPSPVHRVSEPLFAKLAFGDRAEGLVAVIHNPVSPLDAFELPPDGLVVVLEGVEKPGNVGAVLRSADGAGADALIAASPRTDLANPNVIRASAGTLFHVPLAAAQSAEVLAWLRTRGLRIVP